MPCSAPTPCCHPGCYRVGRGRFCAEHAREHERWRGTSVARGYDRAHQRWRRQVLERHPVCVDCRARKSTQAHHLVPVRDGGEWIVDNGVGLCHSCHSRRTGKGE